MVGHVGLHRLYTSVVEELSTCWKGYYEGHVDISIMILEAVTFQDLWIWHSFFGLPDLLNDVNVL
jgi:hypothetical protein